MSTNSSPLGWITETIGYVLGAAFATWAVQSTGFWVAVIYGGLALGAGWCLARVIEARVRPFLPAIGMLAGQLLALFFSMVMLRQLTFAVLDVMFMAGGLVWIIKQPGMVSVVSVSLYEAITFTVSVMAVLQGRSTDIGIVFLFAHAIMVVLLIRGLNQFQQQSKKSPSAEALARP